VNTRGYLRSFEPVQIAPGAPILVTIRFECTEAEAAALYAMAEDSFRTNRPVVMQLAEGT
jgi:hypothetical protein